MKNTQLALPNLKVLVAEDNEVNKLLAKNMLQHWGLQSKTATTGTEAVSMLMNEDFDIILMDIQMPEKNGIEAALEIRNLNNNKKRNTPIIALTANALKGEEQKYFAAGINDYLTKPFKDVDLLETITRVVKNNPSFYQAYFQEIITPHATMSTNQKLYDLTLVKEVTQGNQEFINSLIDIFLETIPATSKEMVTACAKEDWLATSKFAHKLKATIDTMLITSIKEDVRAIETNGKYQTNIYMIPNLVIKVDQVIDIVSQQLREEFGK